ncbi:MAG: elongation factor G [Roseiflexaceae bacterium]
MTRTIQPERIRNIGIIAHIDAGKTTATERMLLASGRIRRAGEVHDGNATMDFDPQERNRGITINAAATTIEWRGHAITIIDTPGHVDFTAEVERSLRVLDGGVALFDAVAGVEPQSETVWRQADRYGVPRICFVNKMDRIGADFERTVAMIVDRFGVQALPIQLPIGAGQEFAGVVDLLTEQGYHYHDDGQVQAVVVPAELQAAVAAARHRLIEALAEHDEALLAAYVANTMPSLDQLQRALRHAVIAGQVVPVLCGAALKNKGVPALLDAVVAYLPAPTDRGTLQGQLPGSATKVARAADAHAPLTALVFKVTHDPHMGPLCYIRIYAGQLHSGSYLLNTTRNQRERVSRMLRIHAQETSTVEHASAGEIVALVGPKQSMTGDTLCDPAHPILLEAIQFPEPVVRVAIEPRTTADRERLGPALRKLCAADPTLEVIHDEETGQLILAGMGELHLEVQLTRLQLEYQVETRRGRPQVAYRETIAATAVVEHTLARQSGGGSGQWARVQLQAEPLPRGAGFAFADAVVGGAVPRQFIPAVEQGVRDALQRGVLAGYPVVDLRVTLLGGAFHAVDSSELAFRTAAQQATRQLLVSAQPFLLEPLMHTEVAVPGDFVGAIIGDLGSRRGQLQGMEAHGNTQLVRALVPLAELFGYTEIIRSLTQGRASASLDRPVYQPLPAAQAAALIERRTG